MNDDNLKEAGANLLAERIRHYWQQRGVTVNVQVKREVDVTRGEKDFLRCLYVIRSDIGALVGRLK
jgi:hypothetical protein